MNGWDECWGKGKGPRGWDARAMTGSGEDSGPGKVRCAILRRGYANIGFRVGDPQVMCRRRLDLRCQDLDRGSAIPYA